MSPFRPAVLLALSLGSTPQRSSDHIVTIDLVKANPGDRDRLVRYYQLNWARARATVLNAGQIVGYRMLVSADTISRWDVALETEYADSASYKRAEEVFRPVLQAQGLTLVDGKSRADLGSIVESRVTTVSLP